jgi:hypothetical protein
MFDDERFGEIYAITDPGCIFFPTWFLSTTYQYIYGASLQRAETSAF